MPGYFAASFAMMTAAASAATARIWASSDALLVSLANTQEPLSLALHGANRPSHEGVVPLYDNAIDLCRRARSGLRTS